MRDITQVQHLISKYMTVGYGHAAVVRISGRSSVTHERQSTEGINVNLLLASRVLVEA